MLKRAPTKKTQKPKRSAKPVAGTIKGARVRRAKATAAPVAAARAPERVEPAVMVVGDHPAASLCALLLREAKIPVVLLDIGSTPNADRLITLNPEFFRLHEALESLRAQLKLADITHARFLGPGGESASTRPASGREPVAHIASMKAVRDALRQLALDAGVPQLSARLAATDVDERGVHVQVDGEKWLPKLLAVADPLPDDVALLLDVPRFPGRNSHIQATARLAGQPMFAGAADEHELILTLDLSRQLNWGWLLRSQEEAQLCVQCAPEDDVPALLEEWLEMLRRHDVINAGAQLDLGSLKVYDLPLAGALMRDVVARRTLLLGPAGGFYSASGEDVYPGCWSAKYAAEIAARAVKADHPQDALGAYRGRWGSTLGDYLRGPQQNLRFLLPLVYKNPVMTQRLAGAILQGESLVK